MDDSSLIEAEAFVAAWQRAGEPRRDELVAVAGQMVVDVVGGSERPFAELRGAALVFVVAAFQMGRDCESRG